MVIQLTAILLFFNFHLYVNYNLFIMNVQKIS